MKHDKQIKLVITDDNLIEFIDFIQGASAAYANSLEMYEHLLTIFYTHLDRMTELDKVIAFVDEAHKGRRLPTDEEFQDLKIAIAQCMGLVYRIFQKKPVYEEFVKMQAKMHEKIATQLHAFSTPVSEVAQ